jgi:hypothetical protein
LMESGNRLDRLDKIETLDLSSTDRLEFSEGAKRTCISAQRANVLNQKAGITEQQIVAYCRCFAEAFARTITLDEFRYIAKNGTYPQNVRINADNISARCNAAARN